MSDPISRLLAAIEKVEHTIELAGPAVIGWAAYRHENGSIKYCSPVARSGDVWVTGGAETEPASVTVVFDPSSVLRHCKADRATVIQYQLLSGRTNYVPGLGETLGVLKMVVERMAEAYGITEEEK